MSFGPPALNVSDSLPVLPHAVKKTKKRKKTHKPCKTLEGNLLNRKEKNEAGRFKVAPGVYICRGFKFFD